MASVSKILVVDDDPLMRELASAKLVEAGYDPVTAENGVIALEMLKTATDAIDLVISDIDMPEMSGFELLRALRAHPVLSELPVIIITASEHCDAVDRAFAEGATSFLSKPLNWALFGHSVKFVLRASKDRQSLKQARDQAEAGARFKDALLSMMSHELRTPLNAIIGFGQILSDHFQREKDQAHTEYADFIVDGGRRLLNGLSDMLLASEACSGEVSLNNVEICIQDIVELALAQPQLAQRLSDRNIGIRLEDPNAKIRCDRTLMSRAISKLVDNALKFSPAGTTIKIASATTKDRGLALMVQDNGVGMSPEKVKELSVPFTQADMSLRRSEEGLGLGLPTVKAIARAHRAKLKVSSVIGDGTRVVLCLPPDRVCAFAASSAA